VGVAERNSILNFYFVVFVGIYPTFVNIEYYY
jgi:hypothetical protein